MNTVLIATVFPAPCNVLANHGEELPGSEELAQCLGMCAALVKDLALYMKVRVQMVVCVLPLISSVGLT